LQRKLPAPAFYFDQIESEHWLIESVVATEIELFNAVRFHIFLHPFKVCDFFCVNIFQDKAHLCEKIIFKRNHCLQWQPDCTLPLIALIVSLLYNPHTNFLLHRFKKVNVDIQRLIDGLLARRPNYGHAAFKYFFLVQ